MSKSIFVIASFFISEKNDPKLFKRSAHSAVPNWMLGCLDALRIGGRIGRIGRMGRIEDQEDW